MSRPSRPLTLVVTVLLISPLAYQLMPSTLPSIPRVHATNRTIFLNGNYPYWNSSSPAITVTQGDTITMMLSSIDGLPHRFLVDADKDPNPTDVADCPSVDPCSSQFGPTTPTTFTFTVNFPAGPYTYICTIHYPNMVGNFIVQAPGRDFGVSSNPSSLTIIQGSNANTTITVNSINNFAGSITLSASSSPSGPTTSFTVNPVTVPASGTATSKLTISIPSGTSPGPYSTTVTAKNSTTSRTTTVSVSVISPASDFTITSNPTSLNIPQGSSGTATITLTSVNSFSGTVTLTPTVSASGPQVFLNTTSVTLSSGGTASATLTAKTASSGLYSSPVSQGSYTVSVNGTSGTLSHTATLSITVGSSPPSGAGNLPTSLIIGVIVAAVAVVAAVVYLVKRRPKTQASAKASVS